MVECTNTKMVTKNHRIAMRIVTNDMNTTVSALINDYGCPHDHWKGNDVVCKELEKEFDCAKCHNHPYKCWRNIMRGYLWLDL